MILQLYYLQHHYVSIRLFVTSDLCFKSDPQYDVCCPNGFIMFLIIYGYAASTSKSSSNILAKDQILRFSPHNMISLPNVFALQDIAAGLVCLPVILCKHGDDLQGSYREYTLFNNNTPHSDKS